MFKYITLYLVSMLPWIEQKAGIVLILAGEEFALIYGITVLSAMTIVPLVLLFTDRVMKIIAKIPKFKGSMKKYEKKLLENKKKIQKYELIGLFLLVVFPGTGMWTASMLASILKMDFFKSYFWITFGSACVGFVYMGTAAGLFSLVKF